MKSLSDATATNSRLAREQGAVRRYWESCPGCGSLRALCFVCHSKHSEFEMHRLAFRVDHYFGRAKPLVFCTVLGVF